jgi:hypothetical protein
LTNTSPLILDVTTIFISTGPEVQLGKFLL